VVEEPREVLLLQNQLPEEEELLQRHFQLPQQVVVGEVEFLEVVLLIYQEVLGAELLC
tara:strand:+ start:217 stop:390 length:174 start_codon:yes stop_codon:yes gene_type:complete